MTDSFTPSVPQSPVPASAARNAAERLLMAKELADGFLEHGVTISYHYARAILKTCPQTVRSRYIKFSDAWTWWNANPDFRPFSEKGKGARRPSPPKKSVRARRKASRS